ncbi:MAG: hypothetical protein ABH865_09405 [Candidatus Omnitrophota bacterium]
MKCPAKKEWVLFYYREEPHGQRDVFSEHLNSCAACRRLYEGITLSLGSVDTQQPLLGAEELNEIITAARARAYRPAREPLRSSVLRVLDGVLRGFFLKPQLAFIGLVLLVAVSLVSMRAGRLGRIQEGIIDVELELAFEDDTNRAIDDGLDTVVTEFASRRPPPPLLV